MRNERNASFDGRQISHVRPMLFASGLEPVRSLAARPVPTPDVQRSRRRKRRCCFYRPLAAGSTRGAPSAIGSEDENRVVRKGIHIGDMHGDGMFGMDNGIVQQVKARFFERHGECGPALGVPMVEGEDQTAVRPAQHPGAFAKDAAHQLDVAAVMVIVMRVDGRLRAHHKDQRTLLRQQLPQPDAEKSGQIAVLHAVEIGRIGDDTVHALIGQIEPRGRALAQQKAALAALQIVVMHAASTATIDSLLRSAQKPAVPG